MKIQKDGEYNWIVEIKKYGTCRLNNMVCSGQPLSINSSARKQQVTDNFRKNT